MIFFRFHISFFFNLKQTQSFGISRFFYYDFLILSLSFVFYSFEWKNKLHSVNVSQFFPSLSFKFWTFNDFQTSFVNCLKVIILTFNYLAKNFSPGNYSIEAVTANIKRCKRVLGVFSGENFPLPRSLCKSSMSNHAFGLWVTSLKYLKRRSSLF